MQEVGNKLNVGVDLQLFNSLNITVDDSSGD